MSTSEIREKLFEKINSTTDEKLLLEATRLLDIQLIEIEQPFELSDAMNSAIDEADKQFEHGEFLINDDANREIEKWLEK